MSPRLPFLVAVTVLGAVVVLSAARPAYGQRFNRIEDTHSNVDAYFYHVQQGAASVQVYVMGTVQAPGLYEVSEGTHLGQLLALSGGPQLSPQRRASDRQVTIRLFRPTGYGERPLYEERLDRAVAHPAAYPALRDGDVMTVEVLEKDKFSWRDIFTVVGAVSALALAVENVVSAAR
jgi:hypothetical protein